MAKQTISNGTVPNDGTGDSLYSATTKINENFTELYGLVVGGSDVTFVNSISAGTGISLSNETGDVVVTNTSPHVASFTSLTVIGQDNILASRSPTLTVVAGNNISLTTEATSNRLVISTAPQAQSNWDATSGVSAILNKPTIPTDFNQLSDVDGIISNQIARFGDFTLQNTEIVTTSLTGINVISQTSTQISWTDTGASTGPTQSNLYADDTGVHINCIETVGPAQLFTGWDFNKNGTLTLPNAVILNTNSPVVCPHSVTTLIYAAQPNQSTIKLLLSIEGVYGTGSSGRDTHSCELMIAKAELGDTVQLFEYGTVYTSAGPLATFTASWNALLSSVEISCQPTSTVNSVVVNSFTTEISKSNL